MSEAGDKGALQQPTDLERRGNVEQLTQEKRKTYSAMMDEMTRQVGNYGKFFVGEGSKGKTADHKDRDTRVLLLNEPVRDPRTDSNMWVAITMDGPKGIVPKQLEKAYPDYSVDKHMGGVPKDQRFDAERNFRVMIDEKLRGQKAGFLQGGDGPHDGYVTDFSFPGVGGNEMLNFCRTGLVPILKSSDLVPVSLETVQEAIRNSQAKARIPEELDVKKANERLKQAGTLLQEARSLDQFIKQLPPKQ